MNFFLKKQLILFKKILRAHPVTRCAIFRPKMVYSSWTNFFGTNHYYYFHLPIGPFHCAKFKKFLQQIQSSEDAQFLGPKWSTCPNENFFRKLVNPLTATFLIWGWQTYSNFPVTSKIMRICVVYFLIGHASHIILHYFSFCWCFSFSFSFSIFSTNGFPNIVIFAFVLVLLQNLIISMDEIWKITTYIQFVNKEGGFWCSLNVCFKFQFKCIFIWAEIVAPSHEDSG